MKQVLLMIAVVVLGQSVLAADVVITNSVLMEVIGKQLEKPHGKFAPPMKLTKAELARVTHLNLAFTIITDAGLKEVAKLQQLTYLHLTRTEITDEGAAELRKALPKCSISHSYKKD